MKKALRLDPIPSKKEIGAFYDSVAGNEGYQATMYAPMHRRQTLMSVKRLLSVMLPFAPNVLEIGCADGMVSRWVAPRVDKLVGLEIIPACLKRCEALRLGNAEFFLIDVEKATAWPKDDFDLVLAMDVIEHLRDPYKFMERARATGRAVLVTTPINEFPNPNAFSMKAHLNPQKDGDGSSHIWCFREDTLRTLFGEVWHYEDNGVTAIVMGR